jgi:hypothetical protein
MTTQRVANRIMVGATLAVALGHGIYFSSGSEK